MIQSNLVEGMIIRMRDDGTIIGTSAGDVPVMIVGKDAEAFGNKLGLALRDLIQYRNDASSEVSAIVYP